VEIKKTPINIVHNNPIELPESKVAKTKPKVVPLCHYSDPNTSWASKINFSDLSISYNLQPNNTDTILFITVQPFQSEISDFEFQNIRTRVEPPKDFSSNFTNLLKKVSSDLSFDYLRNLYSEINFDHTNITHISQLSGGHLQQSDIWSFLMTINKYRTQFKTLKNHPINELLDVFNDYSTLNTTPKK
jgi:hypothetical protein